MSGARPSQTAASLQRRSTILDAARSLITERGVDKLVIADVADRVRRQLASRPAAGGIEGCMQVVTTACETVLADASTVRSVLASVGAAAPDQWLTEGMGGVIRDRVDAAVEFGHIGVDLPPAAITHGIHLGFRGALISWVFGLLDDDELAPNAELMALHVLANAAAPKQRSAAQRRLQELANALSTKDIS